MSTTRAYKLLRRRSDGTLGSLFMDRERTLTVGEWLDADFQPRDGFAPSFGWHALPRPWAPHLSMRGRQWYEVELRDVSYQVKPERQGGLWYRARRMRLVRPVSPRKTRGA